MTSDDSPTASKSDRDLQEELWGAAWLAERTKPSRQRNLTPLQRQQRAKVLRSLRRARWDTTLIVRS
jgi:hypothetical protein